MEVIGNHLPADTFVHVHCDDALRAAGVVLQVSEQIVIGTTHGEVQQVATGFQAVSLEELHIVKNSITRILTDLADPYSLSKEARAEFNENCLILTVAMYTLDPVKNPMRLVRQPQQAGCAVCGCPAILFCGKCRLTRYCGKEHQKIHWKTHKPDCAVRTASPTRRSSHIPFC